MSKTYTKKMLFKHFTLIIAGVTAFPAVTLTAEPQNLPPNWNAGGKGEERFMPKRAPKGPSHRNQTFDEAQFEPDLDSARARRHAVGLFGALPELARLDYRFSLSSYFAWYFSASGPVPVDVNVSMPSDVIKSDAQKGLAVAYPAFEINFKVNWGPYLLTGLAWHPFGGSWYTSFGAGIRSVRIKGHASSPLRICSIIEAAKEPPCANDRAAIQTRNSIALDADVELLSLATRMATGWNFNLGPRWALSLEGGVFAPLRSYQGASVTANIETPDGTPEDLSGALGELRAKSEDDLANKAKEELGKVTNRPLPVLGIGVSYLF